MVAPRGPHRIVNLLWDLLLVALILIGVGMRFSWVNWHEGANLHPDEYGLTNTLTQLRMPASLSEYFNTRISPLSPYRKYDIQGNPTKDGPDNGMRWGQWPQILLRWAAETTGNTGYDELRRMGRQMAAVADTLTVLMLILIGNRLYGARAGLLAAALSALAVMQIQESHFMTVDSFATLFTTAGMYCAVRVAQSPGLVRKEAARQGDRPDYTIHSPALAWYVLFGVSLGMAVASKINLLPLAGMILVAAFIGIADLKLKSDRDLPRIAGGMAVSLAMAGLAAGLTFRVTQPMSFRAAAGETTLLTLRPNPDWVENMRNSMQESRGIGGGPPQEQWAHRIPLLFPLVNMVVWGMGLPLGAAAWAGFGWAAWQFLRYGADWRAHLLPLVWVGGFFLFMGTRWASSMRYFLPIYPFLCLFAAWLMLRPWQRKTRDAPERFGDKPIHSPRGASHVLPAILMATLLLGTFAWAWAFTSAVYRHEHTRIQASKWIYENVPAPFQLALAVPGGLHQEPVPAPEEVWITSTQPFVQSFVPGASGRLNGITVPHVTYQGQGQGGTLRVVIALDREGKEPVDEARLAVTRREGEPLGAAIYGKFQGAAIEAGKTYTLIASPVENLLLRVYRSVISNENWDEGLPFGLEGRDPYGGLYRGVTMEVRWYDDEHKRQMFLDNLAQVDYILLPSQRGIWSTCRLPRTYPMTMEYYRALFDGRLGFDLAAVFTEPLQLGPLEISDVGGTAAWGHAPGLPLFNNRLLAAEEAFSVYDHPPVWIFKKRADFDLQAAQRVLEAIDLSKAVVQAPREADGPACQP